MMRPIKIGYDAKRYFNNQTGLGNYARTLIEGIAKYASNLEIHLFSTGIKNLKTNIPLGVQVHEPKSLFGKLFKKTWRNSAIIRDLKKDQIAIYHGLSNELPLGIEHTNIKSVVTIHDLIFLKYPELYPPIDRMIYNQKVKSAVTRANHVVACSKQTAKDLINYYAVPSEKISVIYQDCDSIFKSIANQELPEKLSAKYGLKDAFILSVGTLEKRKNQLKLLQAFHKANLQHIQLVFVGKKADLYPQMKTFVEENHLQNKVLFLDNIPKEELPALYQMAKLFAYMSFEEGFGIPLLEAMWSGVPILTGNLSCLPEIAADAALCVDPNQVSKIADAIQLLLTDETLRKLLIANGFERALDFDSKKLSLEWQELYASL